jgi:hypothetical protein
LLWVPRWTRCGLLIHNNLYHSRLDCQFCCFPVCPRKFCRHGIRLAGFAARCAPLNVLDLVRIQALGLVSPPQKTAFAGQKSGINIPPRASVEQFYDVVMAD